MKPNNQNVSVEMFYKNTIPILLFGLWNVKYFDHYFFPPEETLSR